MKLWLLLFPLLLFSPQPNFREEQMRNSRVKKAFEDRNPELNQLLAGKKIKREELRMFIRIFKEEKLLEVWARNRQDKEYVLLKSYPVCDRSGKAGPKRKQGDKQVPEGFYRISNFNPWSNYHLSLQVNYPNSSDRILSDKAAPGGEIFIHGKCITIGCIPITDRLIEEVYVLAVEARNNGSAIPVHIFPLKFNEENFMELKKKYPDKMLHAFWENLKEGYELFEKTRKIPPVNSDKKGKYVFGS